MAQGGGDLSQEVGCAVPGSTSLLMMGGVSLTLVSIFLFFSSLPGEGGAALPFFDGLVWSESISANLEKVEAIKSSGGRDKSSRGDHGSPGGVCCTLRLSLVNKATDTLVVGDLVPLSELRTITAQC